MEKTITIYDNKNNFVICKGKMYYYELYSGRIQWDYDINDLMSNENYYKEIIEDKEFNKFEIQYTHLNKRKRLFIPVSKNFMEFYKSNRTHRSWDFTTNKWSEDIIELSNIHLNNNVDAFYEFSLEVVIDNFRTVFERSVAFKDMIYIETPDDENLKAQMSQIFGKQQNIPELEGEQYGIGKNFFFYIVPKSRIDKIIGIKKYRDTSSFGLYEGEQFTGKIEEIVLDLHDFDENIYEIFKEHNILKIDG